MNIVYMGTGEIGLPTVRRLLDHPVHRLRGVFTQPDRRAGRNLVLTPPAMKQLAAARGVPVFQPEKIRAPGAVAELAKLAPEVIVVMAYGQILPRAVFEAATIACINLHASLLPKYRGAAPIQAAIREGETESGITVIHIDEGLDSGDILLVERIPLDAEETGQSLHDRLAELAPDVLEKALAVLARGAGAAPRVKQDASAATHSPKLDREDGRIDWSQPARVIERTIRAYHPWPGTFTRWRPAGAATPGAVVKIYPRTIVEPQPVEGGAAAPPPPPPGIILAAGEDGIVVATGTAPLRITELQLEGRKRMGAGAFLRGHDLAPGARFA